MTELSASFAPDRVLPPGETILDIAEERGWTQSELAKRLGYSEKHVSLLINGKVPITLDAALHLVKRRRLNHPWCARPASAPPYPCHLPAGW